MRKRAKKKPAKESPASQPLAYGYTRVSEERQARTQLGLKAQARDIDDYFKGLLRRKARWAGLFSDPAVSASKTPFASRPNGAKLLERLRRGDHLIVAKLDRAFRDTLDLAATLNRLNERGVIVHLLDIRVDTSTACGRLIVDVVGAVAAWEAKRIGERIAAAKRELRGRNLSSNGVRWLGYRLRGKQQVPDPKERALMAQVVKLRRSGLIWREIAAKMQAAGHRWSKQRCWRAYHRHQELKTKQWPPA